MMKMQVTGIVILVAALLLGLAGQARAADKVKQPSPTATPAPQAPTYKIYTEWPFDAKEARRRQEETARMLGVPVEKTILLPYDVPMKFILIPAGEFVMGSPKTEPERNAEETQHRVRITLPYYIGKFEFLQTEWTLAKSVKGRGAANRSYHRHHGAHRPVDQASWLDTQRALWLMNQHKIGVFTLPTEAEWEFACRAGTDTPFHFGETVSYYDANYNGGKAYGKGKKSGYLWQTTDVGQFPPNPFGLYDMHGNVWEWVWDIYDPNYFDGAKRIVENPSGPKKSPVGITVIAKDGPKHVHRGGGFGLSPPYQLRSAARSSQGAKVRDRNGGFRVVMRTLRFPKADVVGERYVVPEPLDAKPNLTKAGYTIYGKWPFDTDEAKRRQQETAKALKISVEKTIDLGNGVKIEVALVPAGRFIMGSPPDEPSHSRSEKQRPIEIDKPFYIAKYEMTQAQYQEMMDKNDSKYKDPKFPVSGMPYFDCTVLLGKMNELVKKKGAFALPTEAQWEFACRAGTATAFHFGGTASTNDANFDGEVPYPGSPRGRNRDKPMPVGSFKPNAFGLYDMHGNVFEWCNEWYKEDLNTARLKLKPADPTGRRSYARRVMKGGSWYNYARHCRAAHRFSQVPRYGSEVAGIRVIFQNLD
jgi:formylglycine-generating enzyme required for sulfatase activity